MLVEIKRSKFESSINEYEKRLICSWIDFIGDSLILAADVINHHGTEIPLILDAVHKMNYVVLLELHPRFGLMLQHLKQLVNVIMNELQYIVVYF